MSQVWSLDDKAVRMLWQKEVMIMPKGSGTGPMGRGSMTGRAAGYCAGFNTSGYMNNIGGRGFGRGFGRGSGFGWGSGWRNMFNASGIPGFMKFGAYAASLQTPDPDAEQRALKNHADMLQAELNAVRKRLADIETGTSAE